VKTYCVIALVSLDVAIMPT